MRFDGFEKNKTKCDLPRFLGQLNILVVSRTAQLCVIDEFSLASVDDFDFCCCQSPSL